MTGLERNADVVRMASYAPMFAKYGNTQWSAANMIWFNNDEIMLTPNYYVQSLFSNNKGDYSLPTEVEMNGIYDEDYFHGGVVLGSWGTQNEFKNVTLVSGDTIGTISPNDDEFFKMEDDEDTDNSNDTWNTLDDWGWQTGVGEWSLKDGVISQISDSTGSTCFYEYDGARYYTLDLKAKKTGGGEGFQIGVAAEDNLNYYRVNIGGWGNTTAKIQHIVNGVSSEVGNVAEQSYVGEVHIEDNKWYDVRVEVTDYEIKAYLDGEFICSYQKPKAYGPVYASSVYDENAGEVVVKVVNTLGSDVPVDINITGADITDSNAKTFVMEGDTSLENSLENPTAIVPYASEITNAANEFTYSAPANSFTVMRLAAESAAALPNYTHKAYISGYTDYTFRPDKTISRAEAATIIANIDGMDPSKEYKPSGFADVLEGWFIPYINYCTEKGYINGYERNTFMPRYTITRAEFATILARYLNLEQVKDVSYSDMSATHWAVGYIGALVKAKIISGYEDGTIRPDIPLTRAEAVTMLNNALKRNDNPANLINPFTDVTPAHWAYSQILEAAVNH
ncbi:MAG: S-layer homology domain-containing protein [Clostridia bacterium]|nr:S-layer homology domain-containing protein [Clostridia bacterium]